MERLRYPPVVLLITAVFLAYTFGSCASSSESTKELEKYDSYDYADEATFNRSYDDTYRASMAALERMGFVIAVSDERTGEIQGEYETSELRPEERRLESESDDSGGPIVGILAAIAFAVVMLLVSPGCESESDDVSAGPTVNTEPERTHVYVVTLLLSRADDAATTVSVGAARFDYDDDEFVRRVDLENKYLNHSLFDRIEEGLDSEESLPQPGP